MLPGEDPAARRVLMVCLAAGVTTLLDQSVLNIAMPALRQSLSAGAADVQWIVSGYSLAFGLTLVPGGSLGDVRGRKGLFLLGLSVFVLCSVAAATAQHAAVVVAARLVQGAGAGLVNSQVIGTLQDIFQGLARARALGLYAVTAGVASALGPALGGVLVGVSPAGLGWRLRLLLSTPFGVATLWLATRRLPPARRVAAQARLDLGGLACVAALTLSLMLPFIRPPGSHKEAALWAAAALASAGLLVVGQRRRGHTGGTAVVRPTERHTQKDRAPVERRTGRPDRDKQAPTRAQAGPRDRDEQASTQQQASVRRAPLVHPALVRSGAYALGTGVAMAQFGATMAAGLVLALFLQSGLGLPAPAAAAVTLPAAVGMMVASAVAWRVMRRLGTHTVTLGVGLGILALVAEALAAVSLPRASLPYVLAGMQLCTGAASGLTVSPNQARVLQHAPAEAAGVAGGILQMAQRVAAAVCLSAVSGIYLRGVAATTDTPRTAFAQACLVCAGVLTAALVLCLIRSRETPHVQTVQPPDSSGRPGSLDHSSREPS
ncbi:MFS transporter [Streptomyces sp. NPDC002888]|uniref:MFS transporter n=1 Tax=Streptomyces sp. NPDC002888 TaxID=3364668 RepID=UPI0036B685B7